MPRLEFRSDQSSGVDGWDMQGGSSSRCPRVPSSVICRHLAGHATRPPATAMTLFSHPTLPTLPLIGLLLLSRDHRRVLGFAVGGGSLRYEHDDVILLDRTVKSL